MAFGIISVPAAPLRKKSRHQIEMTTQLLFGEVVEILREKRNGWLKVRSMHDDYEGWLTRNLIEPLEEEQAKATSDYVTTDLLNIISINEKTMNIPVGSSLPGLVEGSGQIGNRLYSFRGNCVKRSNQEPGADLLTRLCFQWLNAPYMWGGRTPLGVDCSGFVQVNYKMMGIDLARDAWQQAQEGRPVKKLKEGRAGDLVFFDDKDEIVHVGILLNSEQLIHASGKVRIDTIDKKGIINTDTGKRTHRLEAIRRFW